jgi:hypothetical protein
MSVEPAPFIVCGWHTPDYAHWADGLKASLDKLAIRHDIIERDIPGPWEKRTMRKPHEVLKAMDRHPHEVVIFLDADCTVHGDLAPLAALDCDVAFCMRVKQHSGRLRVQPLSGTLVLRPTKGARWLMGLWQRASFDAPYAATDEDVLSHALCQAEGVRFMVIGPDWSGRGQGAVIRHAYGSRNVPKIGQTQRIVGRMMPKWLRF